MDEVKRRLEQRKEERAYKRQEKMSIFVIIFLTIVAIIIFTLDCAIETEAPKETTPTLSTVFAAETEVTEAEQAPRYDITAEELEAVAKVVHAEACGEGFDGQALVAQCILNTAEATGKRPSVVVSEKWQYATPAKKASEEVMRAVKAVFIDGYTVTNEPIRYFYRYKNKYSAWHENNLEYVMTWGGHRFFKE